MNHCCLSRYFCFIPAILNMILHGDTIHNAELLAMSGPRNPYPGRLGVIEEGALADLILVDGNPLQNIQLIVDPDRDFMVIMKDGKIYRNLLEWLFDHLTTGLMAKNGGAIYGESWEVSG